MGHHGEIRGHVQSADNNTSDSAFCTVQNEGRKENERGLNKKKLGGNVKFKEFVRLAARSTFSFQTDLINHL